MLNRNNLTLSALSNRLNLGTRSLVLTTGVDNIGTALRIRHTHHDVMRNPMVQESVSSVSVGAYAIPPIAGPADADAAAETPLGSRVSTDGSRSGRGPRRLISESTRSFSPGLSRPDDRARRRAWVNVALVRSAMGTDIGSEGSVGESTRPARISCSRHRGLTLATPAARCDGRRAEACSSWAMRIAVATARRASGVRSSNTGWAGYRLRAW